MNEEKNIEKQKRFLDNIKYSLPPNVPYIDELSEILELSPDSIYRRIRGKTELTFTETVKLCQHFNLSFDALVDYDTSAVTFNYDLLSPSINHFKLYLHSILNDLNLLANIENKKIIYIADDIPIFHLFAFPELASFKMYYWMKSVLNIPEYQNQKFSFEETDMEILEIGEQMRDVYYRIPSVEVWTEYTVNSIRKQIEYYWEAGLFENNMDAIKICDQAKELVQLISKLAEKSLKPLDNKSQDFSLYYSEIEIGNNCILVTSGNWKKVYLTYNTFNFMFTINDRFCNGTHNWINYLISKSNLISGVSEKQRFQFVNKILHQIEATKKIIAS